MGIAELSCLHFPMKIISKAGKSSGVERLPTGCGAWGLTGREEVSSTIIEIVSISTVSFILKGPTKVICLYFANQRQMKTKPFTKK